MYNKNVTDIYTTNVIEALLNAEKRPGMYFGGERPFSNMRIFLAGISTALLNTDTAWESFRQDVDQQYAKKYYDPYEVQKADVDTLTLEEEKERMQDWFAFFHNTLKSGWIDVSGEFMWSWQERNKR